MEDTVLLFCYKRYSKDSKNVLFISQFYKLIDFYSFDTLDNIKYIFYYLKS